MFERGQKGMSAQNAAKISVPISRDASVLTACGAAQERTIAANASGAYIAIDLKSFYASVECVERGLDPLRTNLVVADETRTEKTICLAVSPSLKAIGVPGRPRLFEVTQIVGEHNRKRRARAPRRMFAGRSWDADRLAADPSLETGFIVARPQMTKYMEVSARIYGVYLRFVAPKDIFVYSVDEVFIDAAPYLKNGQSAHDFARDMVGEVLAETGITATAGIGTNMYLAKIAMDIVAKKMPADRDGVRVAELDEASYRHLLWAHEPLTDFWRVGSGTAARLAANGMTTMGDVARCSLGDEDLLYRLFGVAAELLIDHAWGYEPTTMADVQAYRPQTHGISMGQVLKRPYSYDEARLIAREMADQLALDMTKKGVACDQITLDVGYDTSNLRSEAARRSYRGEVREDHYGRALPRSAHGSHNLPRHTASSRLITAAVTEIFERVADPALTVRRVNISACGVSEASRRREERSEQLDMFTDYDALCREREREDAAFEREHRRQTALVGLRERFGKNAVFRGMDLVEGATTIERNAQVGGHRA